MGGKGFRKQEDPGTEPLSSASRKNKLPMTPNSAGSPLDKVGLLDRSLFKRPLCSSKTLKKTNKYL